jgi:four helix bundle protein
MADSIARQKSYTFAIAVIRLCTQLKEQKQFEIASQLLRCGTSIGATVSRPR